jgi:hypothetical protein
VAAEQMVVALPESFIDRSYSLYERWVGRRWQRHQTRALRPIWVDRSDAACHDASIPFGARSEGAAGGAVKGGAEGDADASSSLSSSPLRAGDRVCSPLGHATILGTYRCLCLRLCVCLCLCLRDCVCILYFAYAPL